MTSRKEIIDLCLTFPNVYEDYPFRDHNWTVMRRHDTKRGFAWIFERDEKIWVSVKLDPEMGFMFREMFSSVVPAYHMNKLHWSSVILDGSVPEEVIYELINTSFILCGKK